jgi:hypothetical protein
MLAYLQADVNAIRADGPYRPRAPLDSVSDYDAEWPLHLSQPVSFR